MEQLAYSYQAICNILEAHGYTMAQIEQFLIKHQNPSGYIKAEHLPKIKAE